jgi:hypothetical protein
MPMSIRVALRPMRSPSDPKSLFYDRGIREQHEPSTLSDRQRQFKRTASAARACWSMAAADPTRFSPLGERDDRCADVHRDANCGQLPFAGLWPQRHTPGLSSCQHGTHTYRRRCHRVENALGGLHDPISVHFSRAVLHCRPDWFDDRPSMEPICRRERAAATRRYLPTHCRDWSRLG